MSARERPPVPVKDGAELIRRLRESEDFSADDNPFRVLASLTWDLYHLQAGSLDTPDCESSFGVRTRRLPLKDRLTQLYYRWEEPAFKARSLAGAMPRADVTTRALEWIRATERLINDAIGLAAKGFPSSREPAATGQYIAAYDAAMGLMDLAAETDLVWRSHRASASMPPPQVPTIRHHGKRSYSPDGETQVVVTQEEDYVLQAFLKANRAMDTRELESTSGVTNVARVVQGMKKKYGGVFAPAIRAPGRERGAGYHIRVRSA